MASTEPIVQLTNATKAFGDTVAVDALNVAVAPGQIFGLIGPSGCGKTTTIRMLLGVLKPTDGEAMVMGTDPTKFNTRQHEQIGYAPQGFVLYPTLTTYENVRFVASLFGMRLWRRRSRIREVLSYLELWDVRNRLARDLSGGMKRRLDLACALVHEPLLLFVDEPTTGLDPVLRTKIWDLLRELRDRGLTVFVSTQHIDEIARCDNVGVMDRGRLVGLGTPESLRRSAVGGEILEVEADHVSREAVAAVRSLPAVKRVRYSENGALQLVVEDAAVATPAVTETLHDRGEVVEAVRPVVPSFDDVFRHLVGTDERS